MAAAPEVTHKCVFLGATSVGKTCLCRRLTNRKYDLYSTSTIGAAFLSIVRDVEGTQHRLQLWDTAGQERYRSISAMYYRGAQVCFACYDVTKPESLTELFDVWLQELDQRHSGTSPFVFVVGCKADLLESKRVEVDDAVAAIKSFSEDSSLRFAHPLETSAKELTNLDALRSAVDDVLPVLQAERAGPADDRPRLSAHDDHTHYQGGCFGSKC